MRFTILPARFLRLTSVPLILLGLLTALLAYFATSTVEKNRVFGVTDQIIVIQRAPETVDQRDLLNRIHQVATSTKSNFYYVAPDPEDLDHRRTVYSFQGAPERTQEFLDHGKYPDFIPGNTTTVIGYEPLAERTLLGAYYVDAADARLVLKGLEQAGFTVDFPAVQIFMNIISEMGISGILPSLMTLWVVVGFSLMVFVVGSVKYYSRRVLAGLSRVQLFFEDLVGTVVVYLLAAFLATGSVLLWVGARNGWSRLGGLIENGLVVTALNLLLLSLLFTVIYALFRSVSLVDALKRRVSWRTADGLAVFGHVVLVGTLLVLMVQMTKVGADLRAKTAFEDEWTKAKDYYSTSIIGVTPETHEQVMEAILPAYAELDRADKVILAAKPGISANDALSPFGPFSSRAVIVNNAFLKKVQVLDQHGQAVEAQPTEPGAYTLLVPQRMAKAVDRTQQEWNEYLAMSAQVPVDAVKSTVILIADGQDVFTYGDRIMTQWSQKDPIIAVVPAASGLLTDVLAPASNSNILFEAKADAERLSNYSPQLAQHVLPLRAAPLAFSELRRLKDTTLNLALGGALGAAAFLMSAWALSLLYKERERKRIFLQHVNGKGFQEKHAGHVLKSFIITALPLGTLILLAYVPSGYIPRALLLSNATPWIALSMTAAAVLVSGAFAWAPPRRKDLFQ